MAYTSENLNMPPFFDPVIPSYTLFKRNESICP
jgi:hypothetical protein